MLNKEVWDSLSEAQRTAHLTEALTSLGEIRAGRHPLKGTREEGRIKTIRTDLEKLVLNFIEWETAK